MRDMITFVCTANTCRSPMAQKLLEHALASEDEPYKSLKVISTGISAFDGQPAALNSIKALSKVGVDLSDYKSRLLTQEQLDRSFMVLCMTESHRMLIKMSFDNLPSNLYLMRELMPEGHDVDIPDPFGQSLSVYENCRDSMVEAIPHIINFIKKNYEG